MRLVLATRNEHKLRELARMLAGVALEPLPAGLTLPPEDGDTFAANAMGKARAAAAALGRAAIADDSGIEADGAGRRAGHLLRALRRAGRHRRREPRAAARTGARRAPACAIRA